MISVGVDGGREGAACCIFLSSEGPEVLCLVRWKKRRKNKKEVYELVWANAKGVDGITVHTMTTRGRSAWELGVALRNALYAFSALEAREGLCLVSTEDVYVGKNMKTSVGLAKFIGGIVSRVADWDRSGDVHWVKAGAWRKVVLGLGHFTKRDIAKRASLEEIPKRVRRLDEFLDTVGREDHCTDAVGIALWRMIEEGIAQ